jgi:hypothetical protein
MNAVQTYLRTQGELGGFEIVLPPGQPREFALAATAPTMAPAPPPTVAPVPQNDSLWQNSTNINDFYNALRQHSIYTKSMRSLSFCVPKEIKTEVPFFLLFHSPQELTAEAKGILERLFKKLGVDLNMCAISFFFKCNAAVMQREKVVLGKMLNKEIELIKPEKIIFFREAPKPEKIENPAPVNGTQIEFAGKPAITLYSLLEMLPRDTAYKEKMREALDFAMIFVN